MEETRTETKVEATTFFLGGNAADVDVDSDAVADADLEMDRTIVAALRSGLPSIFSILWTIYS